MNNNISGKISMNPKELYNISLTGVDLESRVSDNFKKMNDAFESILQAVKTPELNSKVVALYDIFKQVESNFNQNNKILNEFFDNKLKEYNEHALNVSEASSNLSNNIGLSGDYRNIDSAFGVNPNGSANVAKDIWAPDDNTIVGGDSSGRVELQPVKPVYETSGISNPEPTKVYTYGEDGLKEATNVGYISDSDLMHDTAFGVNPGSSTHITKDIWAGDPGAIDRR